MSLSLQLRNRARLTARRAARLAVFVAALAIGGLSHAGTVGITTSDGVRLSADLEGKGEHGIVFVHGNTGDRSGWGDMPQTLAAKGGVQVITLDLRGHGASKGDSDPTRMQADVEAAIQYLEKRGATYITLVGTKLGGNLSLVAAGSSEAVRNVVMISPALNANGVKVTAGLKTFGDRELLLIAGSDDALALKAVNLIADNVEKSSVEVLDSGGSGMQLVNRATDIETLLYTWGSGQRDAEQKSRPGVSDEPPSALETTGTKLGE